MVLFYSLVGDIYVNVFQTTHIPTTANHTKHIKRILVQVAVSAGHSPAVLIGPGQVCMFVYACIDAATCSRVNEHVKFQPSD